jgi:N-acetylmuramoyl-L-alanine amidase
VLNRLRLATILISALAAFAASLDAISVSRAQQNGQQSQVVPQATYAQNAPAPLIILDPAHGGADPGAHGSNGINESDIVLEYARVMRVALEGQGFRVLLTREGNQDPSFDDRAALANAPRRAIFISLHISTTGAPGTVRAYSLPTLPASEAIPIPESIVPPPVAQPTPHPGLRDWDNAQEPFLDLSRTLAGLAQVQLSQRFRGSPDTPMQVAIRQLRTIAAPAIAVEVSCIAVPDRSQLEDMSSPLAQAIAKAVSDFLPAYAAAAPPAASTVSWPGSSQ